MASGVNQSVRGPGTMSSTISSCTSGRSAGGISGAPTTAPTVTACTGSTSPALSAGGPMRASVSLEQLPSTGATAKPPRTAT